MSDFSTPDYTASETTLQDNFQAVLETFNAFIAMIETTAKRNPQ